MTSRAPDDSPQGAQAQSFHTDKTPHAALDVAQRYLEAAGAVAVPLRGRVVRTGDELMVHYGRVITRVAASEVPHGCQVTVGRTGRVPLEETRRWMFGLGIAGFALAWGLAWYNSQAGRALPPLVTITFFFLAMTAVVVALYHVDRSLENRGVGLLRSLEEAVKGDPILVLQKEIQALERSSSIANAILFYCASLLVEFLIFIILFSDGVRQGIDEAVALDVMRAGFGIPVVPAAIFGLLWYVSIHRLHRERLGLVERRFQD